MFGLATILKLETISKIDLDIYISWKVSSQIPVVTLTFNLKSGPRLPNEMVPFY